MCWACYTPLAGDGAAATATTAAARKAAPVPSGNTRDEKEEKAAVAPWQIGVIAAAILIAGGVGFMSLTGGSSADSIDDTTPPKSPDGALTVPGVPRNSSAPGVTMPSGGGAATVQMPRQQDTSRPSFSVTTPPGRDSSFPNIGIVPSTSVSNDQAAALAKAAYQQMSRGRNFQGGYVYVFRDRNSASAFQTLQRGTRGAPLQSSDYASLSQVWQNTLVRYEYNKGNEDVRYPSQAPNDWWSRESRYTKAR